MAAAIGDAYYGFYLMAMGRGRSRTPERLQALLHEAGFGQVRTLATRLPLQTRVLLARPANGIKTPAGDFAGSNTVCLSILLDTSNSLLKMTVLTGASSVLALLHTNRRTTKRLPTILARGVTQ